MYFWLFALFFSPVALLNKTVFFLWAVQGELPNDTQRLTPLTLYQLVGGVSATTGTVFLPSSWIALSFLVK